MASEAPRWPSGIWPSNAGSSLLSGNGQADPCPAGPIHSSRIAIESAIVVETYALRTGPFAMVAR
jgi:hypothetical protein